MHQAEVHNPDLESAYSLQPGRPWVRRRSLAIVLLLSLVGFFAAQTVIQHATVCSDRLGIVEGALMALGAIVAGAAFNWVSMDVLLSELLPMWGKPSLALSTLLSVILMFAAIRMASIALQVHRWSPASVACLAAACILCSVYASSSALGFCVISRVWLD